MIVELDGVAAHAELDATAFGTRFAVDDDFALEERMRFPAEKAHDVGSPETSDGGSREVLEDTLQISTGFEENVGGELGLIDAQPIAAEARPGDVCHEWIDHGHLTHKDAWPVDVIELLGEFGGSSEIGQPDDLVSAAFKGDVALRQLLTHPLAAVDVDLNRIGSPGLDAHMHP